MNLIQTYISEKLVYALGWTVLHSLWQAMAVALIVGIIMVVVQRHSARLRYRIANAGLFAVLGWSIYTFLNKYGAPESSIGAMVFEGATTAGGTADQGTVIQQLLSSFYQYFEQHLPLIVTLWLLGVGLFTMRVLGGLAYVKHLKYHRTKTLPQEWEHKLITLTQKLGIRRSIQLFESALIRTPVVIGWFKPVILLPIGAVNHLRPEEVEAILAHELAHVFRNDYLLNILQSFIEVIFYFNPAVWWISANIRLERENCCDDIAVELCGNSITYAKALVSLQEMSLISPVMAMTLARNKNQLLNRVKRVLKQPQNKSNIMEKFTATCLLLLAVLALSISANSPIVPEEVEAEPAKDITVYVEAIQTEPIEGVHTDKMYDVRVLADVNIVEKAVRENQIKVIKDTLPKGIQRINITKNGEAFNLKMKDGEIVFLKINGEKIPASEYGNYEERIAQVLRDIPPPPAPPAPPAPPSAPSALNPHAVPAPPSAPGAPSAIPAPPTPPTPPGTLWRKEKDKDKDGNVNIVIERIEGQKPMVFQYKFEGEPLIIAADELDPDQLKIMVREHPGKVVQLFSDQETVFAFDTTGTAFNFQLPSVNGQLFEVNGQLDKLKGGLTEFKEVMPSFFEANTVYEFRDNYLFGNNEVMSRLKKEMIKDGLLNEADKYRIQLTDDFLKVKDKKLPQEVFEKYHKLFEKLQKEHNVHFYREE